jgi:hypothetical protein
LHFPPCETTGSCSGALLSYRFFLRGRCWPFYSGSHSLAICNGACVICGSGSLPACRRLPSSSGDCTPRCPRSSGSASSTSISLAFMGEAQSETKCFGFRCQFRAVGNLATGSHLATGRRVRRSVFSQCVPRRTGQVHRHAVYEAMLPRQPLRYLLADDPGAGKTIMAGLLAKELIARGDLKRCLVVCPGSLVEQWQDERSRRFHLPFEILTNDKPRRRAPATGSSRTISPSPDSISFRAPTRAALLQARKLETRSALLRVDLETTHSYVLEFVTLKSCRRTRYPLIDSYFWIGFVKKRSAYA